MLSFTLRSLLTVLILKSWRCIIYHSSALSTVKNPLPMTYHHSMTDKNDQSMIRRNAQFKMEKNMWKCVHNWFPKHVFCLQVCISTFYKCESRSVYKFLEGSKKRSWLLKWNVHSTTCLQMLVLLGMAFCSHYSGMCLCQNLRKRLKAWTKDT